MPFLILVLTLPFLSFAEATGSQGDFLARCTVSGLGPTDVSFAEEFAVYASRGKPNAGIVSVKAVIVSHTGKPEITRRSRHLPVKLRDIPGGQSKRQIEFEAGAFSEDYLRFEIPKKAENLSFTFPVTWGAHQYFCRAWE